MSDLRKWQKCHTLHLCSSKKPSSLGSHRSDKLLQRSRGRRRWEEAVRSMTLTTAGDPSIFLTSSLSPSLFIHITLPPPTYPLSLSVFFFLSSPLPFFSLSTSFSTCTSELWHLPFFHPCLSSFLSPSLSLNLQYHISLLSFHLFRCVPSSPPDILYFNPFALFTTSFSSFLFC